MSRVPQFGLIIKTDEGGVRGIRREDPHSGKLLVQRPDELVHVHVGVGSRRRQRKRHAGGGAFLVDHFFETRQIRWIGYAYRTAFVARYQTLKLDRDQARQTV